jgi:ABC-type sugar transport system permease subunit
MTEAPPTLPRSETVGARRPERAARTAWIGGEGRLRLFSAALALPAVAVILGLVAYPFLFSIWIAFTDRVIGGGGAWVGFGTSAVSPTPRSSGARSATQWSS